MLTCFPSSEIETPGSLLSFRQEFSGSKEWNSTNSPRKIACWVFGGMWVAMDEEADCIWDRGGL